MGGFGPILSQLFSKPRLTWAALALAAAAFLIMLRYGLGPSASRFTQTASLAAWVLLVVATAFFVLTIIVDASKSAGSAARKRQAKFGAHAALIAAPPDTKAILMFLALNNEDSVWLMQDHPGTLSFRALGFGQMYENFNGAGKFYLHPARAAWLQTELAAVCDLDVPDDAKQRLFSSMKRAQSAIEHMWMAR